MEYKIIKEVLIISKQFASKTRHIIGNVQMPTPFKLQIAQYENDNGYYLFYLNDKGVVVTDTYHDTINGAESQAEWEFGVSSNEWDILIN